VGEAAYELQNGTGRLALRLAVFPRVAWGIPSRGCRSIEMKPSKLDGALVRRYGTSVKPLLEPIAKRLISFEVCTSPGHRNG
jgi:hypothetical protein